jgi:hypothetical protein
MARGTRGKLKKGATRQRRKRDKGKLTKEEEINP